MIIEPVELLASLRERVLSINDKRCPKWRFRLTAEAVMQLQPRPQVALYLWTLYEGMIIRGTDIRKDHFSSQRARYEDHLSTMEFHIDDAGKPITTWEGGHRILLQGHPGKWKVGINSVPTREKAALEEILITGLPKLNQLNPDMMFQPACLACGKRLTDPVSMARWIGPECSHNHTLDARFFNLS